MSFAAPGIYEGPYAAAGARSGAAGGPLIDRLRLGSLWLLGAISGFVMIEPAPYEFLVVLSAIVFVATGLTLRTGHLPLMFLLIFYNIGFATSLVPVIELEDTAKWTAVSCFLSLTTLFFAVALADDTARRVDILMRGYVACAVITSIIAMLAYFKLIPGWETFIFALRARSTFKDPNVFGPFLVLPGADRAAADHVSAACAPSCSTARSPLIVAAGLFLSFSRGAWGHFGASALIMLMFTYLTTRSSAQRLRIVVVAAIGAAIITAFIVALLSLDEVADLFKQRASLVQNYDAGHLGRFGRHILGALLIFDHPLGVGPLQFSKYFPEDPAQLVPRRLHGGRLARRLYVLGARPGDARRSGCATCSSAPPGSRPISRPTPPSWARWARATSSTCSTGATTT